MKAHIYKARLSTKEQERMEEYILLRAKSIAEEAVTISTQNIFLQTIYLFYNDPYFNFRAKRLKKLCDKLMKQKAELDKLNSEQTMAAVMIERMKSCGADFTPTFRELLENEEQRFKQMKDKEYGKRCAGK